MYTLGSWLKTNYDIAKLVDLKSSIDAVMNRCKDVSPSGDVVVVPLEPWNDFVANSLFIDKLVANNVGYGWRLSAAPAQSVDAISARIRNTAFAIGGFAVRYYGQNTPYEYAIYKVRIYKDLNKQQPVYDINIYNAIQHRDYVYGYVFLDPPYVVGPYDEIVITAYLDPDYYNAVSSASSFSTFFMILPPVKIVPRSMSPYV